MKDVHIHSCFASKRVKLLLSRFLPDDCLSVICKYVNKKNVYEKEFKKLVKPNWKTRVNVKEYYPWAGNNYYYDFDYMFNYGGLEQYDFKSKTLTVCNYIKVNDDIEYEYYSNGTPEFTLSRCREYDTYCIDGHSYCIDINFIRNKLFTKIFIHMHFIYKMPHKYKYIEFSHCIELYCNKWVFYEDTIIFNYDSMTIYNNPDNHYPNKYKSFNHNLLRFMHVDHDKKILTIFENIQSIKTFNLHIKRNKMYDDALSVTC